MCGSKKASKPEPPKPTAPIEMESVSSRDNPLARRQLQQRGALSASNTGATTETLNPNTAVAVKDKMG